MAFDKTVNYVEGVPVNLGYSNEIDPIAHPGTITVTMKYDEAGGRINTNTSDPAIKLNTGGNGLDRKDVNEFTVTGPVANINTFLNQLEWMPRSYNPGEAGDIPPDEEGNPPPVEPGDGKEIYAFTTSTPLIHKYDTSGNLVEAGNTNLAFSANLASEELEPYYEMAITGTNNGQDTVYRDFYWWGELGTPNPFDLTAAATIDEQLKKMPPMTNPNESGASVRSSAPIENDAEFINDLGDTGQMSTVIKPYVIDVSGKNEGEIEVDLWNQSGTFAIGDAVRLTKPNLNDPTQDEEYDYDFSIVAVDGSRVRLKWPNYIFDTQGWHKYKSEPLKSPENEVKAGSQVSLYQQLVKYDNITNRNIVASGWIVDFSYNNSIGQYPINIEVFEGSTQIDTGTTLTIGALYSARPTLSAVQTEIDSPGRWKFTDDLLVAATGDTDNSQITVQLLIKRNANDPEYEWGNDFLKGKPSYVMDNSYGQFTQVRVGDRISRVFSDSAVRWEFFGTIDECNQALQRVRLLDKAGGSPYCVDPDDSNYPETPSQGDDWTLDYFIEVRAIDGWTRTFNSRGYN